MAQTTNMILCEEFHVDKVLCMNGGEGDKSYARNSSIQKEVILRVKPILEETISKLLTTTNVNGFHHDCIHIVDMGCSSGPNTFLPTWEIIDTIDETFSRLNQKSTLVLQVFLVDLPTNDFNTVFKSLARFHEHVEKEKGGRVSLFMNGVPGSFHGRLFPSKYLHFVYSSWSLHWLSQIPKGLVSEGGSHLNKGNIYITKSSPPSVYKAYLAQFEHDFTSFLISRSKEMVAGSHMVLTLLASASNGFREEHGPSSWQLTGIVLHEMASEGLIEEAKLDSFNMPIYTPTEEELRSIIESQGSFIIDTLEKILLTWEDDIYNGENLVMDKYGKGKHAADRVRAVGESLLSNHFGVEVMDDLFQRWSIKAADYMEIGKGVYTTMIVSLSFNG